MRLLQYAMGYKTVSFKKEHTGELLNFLHEKRVVNWGYRPAEDHASINIALSDYEYFLNFLPQLNFTCEQSETRGLAGFFEKYKKRTGVWVGLALFFAIVIASSLFVWDVRVIGAEKSEESEIIENLSLAGLSVGDFIPLIHTTEIVNNYLVANDGISWMSINPKGNVVYVEIIEEKSFSQKEQKGKYANLVASEDAIIECVEPSRGSVVASVGKTVKKGDLLISGVFSSPRRYSFTYADGSVLGRVERELSVEIPLVQVQKEYKKTKNTQISVNFFGFTINIFRYYGKMPAKYDTIYKRNQILLFDTVRLPIYINSVCYVPYEDKVVKISEEQAVTLAFNRLESEFFAIVGDADVISKNIEGAFTENSYILKCRAECIKNIAIPLEFEMN